MRQWQILLIDLDAAGGGPLAVSKFDHRMPSVDTRTQSLRICRAYGFAAQMVCGHGGHTDKSRWVLTNLGRDYLAGRAAVATTKGGTGPGRPVGKNKVVATWLMAAPRPGQIRIST